MNGEAKAPSTRELIGRLGAALDRHDKLVAESGAQADGVTGAPESPAIEVETASEHIRNALQVLRPHISATRDVAMESMQLERVRLAAERELESLQAIESRLVRALKQVETVDFARVQVSGRQRTVERMLGQVVEALGLDDTDWHITDVLKTIAALQAPARGRRS